MTGTEPLLGDVISTVYARVSKERFRLNLLPQGNYFASLDWARQQQAKFWELRAAMSMAGSGAIRASGFFAPLYGWFTEGFDTRDLKEAKARLNELAACRCPFVSAAAHLRRQKRGVMALEAE